VNLFNACSKSPKTSFKTVCKGYITRHKKPAATAKLGFGLRHPPTQQCEHMIKAGIEREGHADATHLLLDDQSQA
jgi:hypothetical protein